LPGRFALHGFPADPLPAPVTIAVVDTGIDAAHPTLAGAAVGQLAFAAPAAGAHGTAIASLLVGRGQVPGVARGARLLALAAFTETDGRARSDSARLARALDSAAGHRPHILLLAFGGRDDPLLTRLLDRLHRDGTCIVAAGGNGGAKAQVPFPATHGASLAVTAVDQRLKPYAHSTPGARLDVAAAGVDLMAAVPGGYRQVSGTSFAAALVAGGLARLPACTGARAPARMRAEVRAAARDLGPAGPDPRFGAGLFQMPPAEKYSSKR
jgi:subtilisin family serine protease